MLVGCGDGLPALPPHGGARLQLVGYAYDDGAEQLDRTTFYDTELDARCRAAVFSDGARYCLPLAARGETVFVDDRCTRSLGLSRTSRKPPAYFIGTYQLGGDVRPSRLYRPGPPVEPPALVWQQQDGYCIGATAAEPGNYFALTEELATGDLARITENRRVTGSEVAAGIDTSEDGLAAVSALYDLEHGPCELVTEAGVSEAICIARSLPRADYFADADCSVPVVAVSASQSDDRAAYHDPHTGCWSIAAVEPAQISGPVFERIDTVCVSVTPPLGATLHALVDSMPPPALARVRVSGGARLDVIDLVDGAVHLPSTHVFDRELDADCTPEEREGTIVCVPAAPISVTTVFTEDTCEKRRDLAFVPGRECDPATRFASSGDTRYPIEAPYTQPFYELEPGDRCGPFAAPPGHVAYRLGPAMPVEAFARASLIQR